MNAYTINHIAGEKDVFWFGSRLLHVRGGTLKSVVKDTRVVSVLKCHEPGLVLSVNHILLYW